MSSSDVSVRSVEQGKRVRKEVEGGVREDEEGVERFERTRSKDADLDLASLGGVL